MRHLIKRKVFLYFALYLALMGAVSSLLYSRYEILTDTYIQSHVKEFDVRIESYQAMQQRMMDNYYGMFLDSSSVSQIMYQAIHSDAAGQMILRRELYNQMKVVFDSLQEFDTRLLFFHLPGQVAFLRVHEPEKFGDDLTVTRQSIVYAQQMQKKVVVFETGKYVSHFRSVYPLFYKGHFTGTVEIAYTFLALKRQAILQDQGAYTFLIKRSILTKKSKDTEIVKHFQDSLFGSDYIEDQESALLKDAEGFEKGELEVLLTENKAKIEKALKQEKLQGIRLTHRGKDALMILKPVYQIGGEQAAYMVEITSNHEIFATQWNQFIVLVSMLAILLALLMWYVYRYNRSVLLSEQYKEAIEESMIVSRTDTKGIITYVNPLFVKISGYTQEELLGQPHSIVRHPDTPETVFKAMWHTLQRGRNWHGMLQNSKKNGESYFVKNLICPIVDEDGKILEYLGLREDVTEIQNSRLRAQEAERIKSAFVANMSHEIRTPINGVVGFIHLLSKTALDTTQRRYVSVVESSLEMLLHIVNDVLDFSKIEEGKIEIEWIKSYPKRELTSIFELFIPQADIKKIDYQLILDERIENCLILDILRIKQVLSNLISNALKFTPEEGLVHVKIDVVQDTPTSQELKFSVSDTGIGIPKSKQGKIFEKFTQADASTTREYGGTGLGLSIANAIVELMGGVITIQSEEGKGATFSFHINAQKCDASEDEVTYDEQPSMKPLDLRVLVVDDYEMNRMLIGELLSYHYGITADFANNGEEAVEMVHKNTYDLVLMDVNMPIMDGIQATKLIRKEYPALPIIALTANVMEGDAQEFTTQGMNDYLAKPLDYDELHRVLTRFSTKKELA
ncbi:MAG: ATP-binding protein [Sulfuricurvum sp.]|nr:ATP-binding protein [Sulfuricurvum sp.]